MSNIVTKHTVGITANGVKTNININIDWKRANNEQIMGWAARSRVIDLQRVLRACTPEFIKSLDGRTFDVSTMGNKIVDPQTRIDELIASGVPAEIARLVVNNPDALNKIKLDK